MSGNRTGMEHIKVSLFASAVRPKLWESYLESLKSTSVTYEVIFSGFNSPEEVAPFIDKYPALKYIHTGRIKPSQNYAISSRACSGETLSWSCDDAEYNNDVLGKAYNYWKSKNNEKLILSIQTKESGYGLPEGKLFNMDNHRFFGYKKDSPLMAPMALINRNFFNNLGGYDRRYIAGQTENDILMRAYADGGTVEIFGDKDCYIDIDHLGKSYLIGESKTQNEFLKRPFAKGYPNDRKVLENSWARGELAVFIRRDKFEPFEEKDDLYTKSQSNNIQELWE